MVFCYKIITESPSRRSGSASPRKASPTRLPCITSSISQLINSWDYEAFQDENILESVPEREWRLLAALARKREKNDEREKLADQFRKMWQREKEERDMVEAETSGQYKRYLQEKRQAQRVDQEFRSLQRKADQQIRKGQLIDCIQYKQRRSEGLLAFHNDKKASDLIEKALEDEARCLLAADRRSRLEEAQEWRKRLELVDAERRVDDARKRRYAMLKDASQRVAISNALSTWESSLLQQELTALDVARRANHAARAAITDARSLRLARARDARLKRARRVAAFTEQLRDLVRDGRS